MSTFNLVTDGSGSEGVVFVVRWFIGHDYTATKDDFSTMQSAEEFRDQCRDIAEDRTLGALQRTNKLRAMFGRVVGD